MKKKRFGARGVVPLALNLFNPYLPGFEGLCPPQTDQEAAFWPLLP